MRRREFWWDSPGIVKKPTYRGPGFSPYFWDYKQPEPVSREVLNELHDKLYETPSFQLEEIPVKVRRRDVGYEA